METNHKESLKPDWYKYPKKKHAIIFSVLFLIGFLLESFAATDGFRESAFYKANLVLVFVVLIAATKVYSIWKNYFKILNGNDRKLSNS